MANYLVREEDGTSKFTLEDGSGSILLEGVPTIDVPFISATTTVYTPTLAAQAKARLSQLPVEAIIAGASFGRLSQLPVEVVVAGASLGRLSQLPVEVAVQLTEEDVNVIFVYWTVGDP